MAVVVGAVPIALVEPALVLALELVVEHDAIDVPAAALEAPGGAFVRAIDLDVVGELALAFNAVPEGLRSTPIAVAMVFEQAPAFLRECDRVLTRTGHSDRLNQTLFPEMPQIARARIERSIVLVAEITTGDHSKGTDRRECPRLRTAERVLAIAIAHELAFVSAREIQITRKDITRIVAALALRPARIAAGSTSILIRLP
jgi:hypothetical protein